MNLDRVIRTEAFFGHVMQDVGSSFSHCVIEGIDQATGERVRLRIEAETVDGARSLARYFVDAMLFSPLAR